MRRGCRVFDGLSGVASYRLSLGWRNLGGQNRLITMAQTADINPRIMAWARETAGLSVEQAAEKLGLKDTVKMTAAEKLRATERGDRPASASLIEKAVTVYRRPLIAFYLPKPPTRGDRGEDFRQIAGTVSPRDNGMLDALIRDVRTRQQMLLEVLADNDEAVPLAFVASASPSPGYQSVAAAIRAALGLTIAAQRQARGADGLFRLLRTAAEKIGVYVLLQGDLGSHHSDIGEDVFRGFALSDAVAPFVVINDNDATPARAFTLMHELAHIWIGASGVSGPLRSMSDNRIERFCNDVAGELLLPTEAVANLSTLHGADVAQALALTADVARSWNVSQGVVTYRFARNGWLSDDVAAALFRAFAERWRADRQRVRDTRDKDDRGPSPYVLRRSRLGAPLLNVVRRALQGATLSHTRAAKILGVAPSAVDALLRDGARAA